MASSKRTGFFWGEEKVTLVEFEKNVPLRVVSSPFSTKTDNLSPFSSDFSEEIEITLFFQKMLKESLITESPFYVSLPVKEVILRSFVIPFAKPEDVRNIVKFEVRKYLPIALQELTFAYYAVPFTEDKIKYLRVIFFAVRKEVLERYERILKQSNITVFYCEPCVVSLAKALLLKKEISPSDHVAFLNLYKNSGCICFISQGMPGFIREFSIRCQPPLEETKSSMDSLNLKIVNEVGNSFDFYARQFSGDPVEQILVSAESANQDLFDALEAELKLKVKKLSPTVTVGTLQSNDMDTIYAVGACLEPPIEELSEFNFLESKRPGFKFKGGLIGFLKSYKEMVFIFVICVISLVGVRVFFQAQLKNVQQQYDQLSSRQGVFLNVPMDSVQTELQQSTDKLTAYKNIRTKSDMVFILLKLVSHLPHGALLKELTVKYDQGDPNSTHVTIDMRGEVFKEEPNEEIKIVNQIFSDFKNDKALSPFIKKVTVSLNLEASNGRQVTGFYIHCS